MIPASDPDYDLIVFGAGAAGMTAALVAALKGGKVLLCEATEQVGGTTATSAGTLWIPGNAYGHQIGGEDVDAAARYLDALAGPADSARRRAFLFSGAQAIAYLEHHSEVKFAPSGRHPDYVRLPGAATEGRAISPLPFDGRRLGKAFSRVRPPIAEFMVAGGMMVGKADISHLVNRFRTLASFRHAVRLVCRHLIDRLTHDRGTRLVMGNALVARLYSSLLSAGVEVRFGSTLESLCLKDGRVVGAIVRGAAGAMEIRRRRGVVLATGGASRHPVYRAAMVPEAYGRGPSLVTPGSTGAGVAAATRAGAAFENKGVYWQPVSRTSVDPPAGGLFPHLFLDRAKPGLIAVQRDGRRFTNEAASYHHFCEGMVRAGTGTPDAPAWLVCDSKFLHRYGIGAVHPGKHSWRAHVRAGTLLVADTLMVLARKMNVDPVGLEASVLRNNQFAASGRDLDFGRGEDEVDRFNGDPEHSPNPCIGLISAAPFHAMAVWPADVGAMSGVATDENGSVLDAGGMRIQGLYACGNDMSSIMGNSYPGPGITLGPAVVFAYRAALHATDPGPTAVAR